MKSYLFRWTFQPESYSTVLACDKCCILQKKGSGIKQKSLITIDYQGFVSICLFFSDPHGVSNISKSQYMHSLYKNIVHRKILKKAITDYKTLTSIKMQ